MRELNDAEKEVIRALNKNPRPITVTEITAGGRISRGKPLKDALIDLEKDGLIESRLPMATSPMRLYRALV